MISFVTWLWSEPGHPRQFLPEYVNVLRAMLARHCARPHQLICVTDNPHGLDPRIKTMLSPATFAGLRNPAGYRFPSCYRRLWNFSRDAISAFGPQIVALDIDVIIVRDLEPLLQKGDRHYFVGWTDPRPTWKNKVAGGLYMLRTGMHTHVWDDFDAKRSPARANECGVSGSDQAWMSYQLYPPAGQWTAADGVVSMKWLQQDQPLPSSVRIISTPGDEKPWSKTLQKKFPWISKHWKL